MKNADMVSGRFARWAAACRTFRTIDEALAKGCVVTVGTYTKVTRYDSRHREMFSMDRKNVYVQAGKRRDPIGPGLCDIKVWEPGTKFSGSRRG